jgi:hypothetical protein
MSTSPNLEGNTVEEDNIAEEEPEYRHDKLASCV